MNKLEEIKNQLASRLEKQSKEVKTTSVVNQPIVTKPKKTNIKKVEQKTFVNASNQTGALKLSVSLYDFDINCLDKIKDYMREKGIRKLSDSEALRLACRAVETNNNFLSIYESMQTEDRRRKRS